MGQSVIWALLSGTLIVLTTTHQSVSDSKDLCTPRSPNIAKRGRWWFGSVFLWTIVCINLGIARVKFLFTLAL